MPTIKMGEQNGGLGSCRTSLAPYCPTPIDDGRPQSQQICGRTRCEWVTMPRIMSRTSSTGTEGHQWKRVMTNPKHWHHFGCPAYVLDGALQGGAGIFHKWKERSKMGIYLGRLPQHARLVALVLNLTTGHVSPQFHIKFDPSFHTTSEEERPPPSLWQTKAGFVSQLEGVKQRADSVKTVTFQQAAGSDIPRSQESRLLQKETARAQLPQQRARAPTNRLRA